mmetsp:Transcript_36918/g.83250  ORF Transcript_36918/g.83250 Transcript_36918/m.83250 type:complete len:182 (+) Transcript_36918:26-571(+)
MTKNYRNFSKTSKTPRRPYEKERLDYELKIIGEYGLKNKREVWRVQLALSKIRSSARLLLTLQENDPRRTIQANALIKRLKKYGILSDNSTSLESILSLKIQDFLERRLQTLVFKKGLARSIHHARILVRHKHISVNDELIDIPSLMVKSKNQNQINFFKNSPYGGGLPGRVRRKALYGNI